MRYAVPLVVTLQPFYSLLAEFEQSDKPFDQFLPILLEHLPEYN